MRAILSAFVFAGLAGGVSNANADTPAAVLEQTLPGVVNYVVGPGDTLSLVVFGEDDLTVPLPVDRDGNVHVPYLGTVRVQGLTSRECAELVEMKLRDGYLVDPQVTITVAEYGAQPVQVLGEVESPGVYYLKGNGDILELVARAGGAPENVTRARIFREGADGREVIEVDLEAYLNPEGVPAAEVVSGDTVHLLAPAIVFVSGEVEEEGAVPWREGMTAWQALTRAGGARRTAKLRGVYILRDGVTIPVNLDAVARGEQEDVLIRPNDQIVVPESMF